MTNKNIYNVSKTIVSNMLIMGGDYQLYHII